MTTRAQIIAAAKESGFGDYVHEALTMFERFYNIAFNAGGQNASGRIEQLESENAEWRAKAKNWMASPEAAKNLDGYRELGTKLAKLEAEREELRSIIALYDKAMTASWPEGARGEAFDHWNAARKKNTQKTLDTV